MSTSARELTDPTSAGTAQATQPSDPPGKANGEVRQAISPTSERLADTVKALAEGVDLPTRIVDKAHQSKEAAQAEMDEVSQHLHQGAETLRNEAEEATLRAKGLTYRALAKLPPPVTRRIEGLWGAVRQRPVLVAVVAVGVSVMLGRLLRGST